MRSNYFSSFRNEKFTVVVEKSIEGFENVGRSQIEFVEYDPISSPKCTNENSFLEDELARVRIRNISSDLLFHVRMLVIVDTDESVP